MSDIDNADVMELISGPLPMHLNLSDDYRDLTSAIGWARVYRKSNGTTHIAIELSEDASEKLGDMVTVFELKAVGFAGIARRQAV